MSDAIVQPNNTVYINNLNEKISVEGTSHFSLHLIVTWGLLKWKIIFLKALAH
jgi:hypothetical protein